MGELKPRTTCREYMAGVIPWEWSATECPRCGSGNYRGADPPMRGTNNYCRACGWCWNLDDAEIEEHPEEAALDEQDKRAVAPGCSEDGCQSDTTACEYEGCERCVLRNSPQCEFCRALATNRVVAYEDGVWEEGGKRKAHYFVLCLSCFDDLAENRERSGTIFRNVCDDLRRNGMEPLWRPPDQDRRKAYLKPKSKQREEKTE